MRRAAGAALVRFVLFCGAFGLLRWAHATYRTLQEEFGSTFVLPWDRWTAWLALSVGAGFVIGLACLPGRPARYRLHVPLAITLPALLLIGHWVLMAQAPERGWERLPWILNNAYFYMDVGPQHALAMIAGFGIAAGFRERPRAEPASPYEGEQEGAQVRPPSVEQ